MTIMRLKDREKKTRRKSKLDIKNVEVSDLKIIPMTVDDSKIIPMTVDDYRSGDKYED